MDNTKQPVKICLRFKRKPGMTLVEFEEYWEKQHGPLVRRVWPNLRKYVQVHPYNQEPPLDSPLAQQVDNGNLIRRDLETDAIVESYWDSMEAWLDDYNNWYLKEPGRELREDEAKFIDMSSIRFFMGREIVFKDELGHR